MKIKLSDFDRDEDSQIFEISKEFFPKRIVRKGKDWICPICKRPHYKHPGPFTCGMTVRKSESIVTLWVRSLGCCGWAQHIPFEKIKERKIESLKLIPVLKRIFCNETY